jgi:xanthine dehydrogenase accessory factor
LTSGRWRWRSSEIQEADVRDILNEILDWQQADEQIALATVVRASGSSPRPVGAKLAVTASGKMAGSVSGGCVEGAVFETAMQVLESGKPELVHYGISDELAWDVGPSCGGQIDVFIEPLRHETVLEAQQEDEALALVTLLGGDTSGAHLVVDDSGVREGSLGDPQLDAQAVVAAQELLSAAKHETRDLPASDGQPTEVYIESYVPRRRLVVVGAVHIAIPLVTFAKELGYHTTVIDPRGLFATGERFPHADELIEEWPDEALSRLRLGPQTDIVLLAHDPKFEDPAMEVALHSRAGYIGAMGSKHTSVERAERLKAAGFSDEAIGRIHGPVGLNIGARTPAEIAVSILAEIIAVRAGKDPQRALAPAKADQTAPR